jgi:hypothetical protein
MLSDVRHFVKPQRVIKETDPDEAKEYHNQQKTSRYDHGNMI